MDAHPPISAARDAAFASLGSLSECLKQLASNPILRVRHCDLDDNTYLMLETGHSGIGVIADEALCDEAARNCVEGTEALTAGIVAGSVNLLTAVQEMAA